MVWPFTSNQDPTSAKNNDDPLRDLDPSLRAFLEKESPVKYDITPTKASLSPPTTPTSTPSSNPHSQAHILPSQSSQPLTVPTLFPEDNRYAHLWKTYTPLSTLETTSASPQERLSDVLAGYKERKASIGRAALQNCADEQWAQRECWHKGSVKDRMTMCREQVRSLERCYIMNTRFLKALGYLSAWDRPAEVEESIQMHADKLYGEMLERERVTDEARRNGEPMPTFGNLLPNEYRSSSADTGKADAMVFRTASSLAGERETRGESDTVDPTEPELPAIADGLSPKIREQFKERLKKLGPVEREVEERAIGMEVKAGIDVENSVKQVMQSTAEQKKKRMDTGQATIGDKFGSFFGR